MKRGDCYWFANECRNGHLVGCPVTEYELDPDDPWEARTSPGPRLTFPEPRMAGATKLADGRWAMPA